MNPFNLLPWRWKYLGRSKPPLLRGTRMSVYFSVDKHHIEEIVKRTLKVSDQEAETAVNCLVYGDWAFLDEVSAEKLERAFSKGLKATMESCHIEEMDDCFGYFNEQKGHYSRLSGGVCEDCGVERQSRGMWSSDVTGSCRCGSERCKPFSSFTIKELEKYVRKHKHAA